MMLCLALTFFALGITPVSLAWHLLGLAPQRGVLGLPAPYPAASSARQTAIGGLVLPAQAWTASTVPVSRTPATHPPLATLGPGFPVTITSAVQVDGVRWDQITWIGPTLASSGSGWVPHSTLSSIGSPGAAEADVGALSQPLAAALAPSGRLAGLAVYYPDVRQVYTSGADVAYPLGDGVRGVLEADLLASGLAEQPTLAGQSTQSAIQDIGTGDAIALSLAYAQLGGSAQVGNFLGGMGISGFTFDQLSWSAATATPRALAQYYAALAGITPDAGTLSASVRSQTLAALAPTPETAALAGLGAPLPQGASVLLVIGTAQVADGWTVNAAGVITAPSGVRYVVAFNVRGQPSSDAAQAAVGNVLRQLAALADT
jgi:hypothetical protein